MTRFGCSKSIGLRLYIQYEDLKPGAFLWLSKWLIAFIDKGWCVLLRCLVLSRIPTKWNVYYAKLARAVCPKAKGLKMAPGRINAMDLVNTWTHTAVKCNCYLQHLVFVLFCFMFMGLFSSCEYISHKCHIWSFHTYIILVRIQLL